MYGSLMNALIEIRDINTEILNVAKWFYIDKPSISFDSTTEPTTRGKAKKKV